MPTIGCAAARGDARRLAVVAYECRHVVTAAHERVEHGGTDVSRCAGQKDPHREPYHSSTVPRDTLIDFFRDLAQCARRLSRVRRRLPQSLAHLRRSRARRARLSPPACMSWGSAKATRLSSGARTVRSGSSPSGAVSSRGIVVVPIDYRASPDFLSRVSRIVAAKLVLIGQDVPPIAARLMRPAPRSPIWKLHELTWAEAALLHRACPIFRCRATMWRRSSSRPARPPSPKASSSPTATSWRTSFRSNAKS